MKEESLKNIKDQELEKYRLVGHWSFHFLNQINLEIEAALSIETSEEVFTHRTLVWEYPDD